MVHCNVHVVPVVAVVILPSLKRSLCVFMCAWVHRCVRACVNDSLYVWIFSHHSWYYLYSHHSSMWHVFYQIILTHCVTWPATNIFHTL